MQVTPDQVSQLLCLKELNWHLQEYSKSRVTYKPFCDGKTLTPVADQHILEASTMDPKVLEPLLGDNYYRYPVTSEHDRGGRVSNF